MRDRPIRLVQGQLVPLERAQRVPLALLQRIVGRQGVTLDLVLVVAKGVNRLPKPTLRGMLGTEPETSRRHEHHACLQ
ncbi:hypothetical protein ACFL5O_08375 [Myxococcota bacterium]